MAFIPLTEKDNAAVSSCLGEVESIKFREGKIPTNVLEIISDGVKDRTPITPGTVLINKRLLAELNSTNIDSEIRTDRTDLVRVKQVVVVDDVPIGFVTDDFCQQRVEIDPENSNWVPLSRVGEMNGDIFIPNPYIVNKIHESEITDRARFQSRDDLKATLLAALKGDRVDWDAHLCSAHFDNLGNLNNARRVFNIRVDNIKLEILSNKVKINPFELKKGNVVVYLGKDRSPKFLILIHDPIITEKDKVVVCKFKVLSPNPDYRFSQAVNGYTYFSDTFDYSWEGTVFKDIDALNTEYKKLGDRIKEISRRIKDGILQALGWK